MKDFIICFCCCVVFLLPITAHTKPTGEIVFYHPQNDGELLITRIEDTHNVSWMYQHKHRIRELTAHPESSLIAFLAMAGPQDRRTAQEIFLVDISRKHLPARNLTQGRFGTVMHFAISKNGDIVFTNWQRAEILLGIKVGIYLIPRSELREETPRATLLVEGGETPVWFEDGERIAYAKNNKLFTFNITNGNRRSLPIHPAKDAAVSPDGNNIALPIIFERKLIQIEIRSLDTHKTLASTRPPIPVPFRDLKWSPDGQYIVYTGELDGNYNHVAVPFNKDTATLDVPVDILTEVQGKTVQKFVWASLTTYPVEPMERLTTLWGKLKK